MYGAGPDYPKELVNDTLYTMALVRNHGFVENFRIMGADAPFTGQITITGSDSPDGQSVTVIEGGPEALTVEGDIYQNGSPLTAWGFQTGLSMLGNWGNYIITLAVFLFALSTMISWSYYGDRSIQYLIGDGAIMPYRYIYCIVLFIGATSKLEDVWGFGDVALGLMAIPNLIAILLLSKPLKNMTKEYFSRKHEYYSKKIKLF
jgi:AGCS family alanine or glycine:cation symporter